MIACGGSARPEAWSQPIVRVGAILSGGTVLLIAPPAAKRLVRPPMLFLGALSALIILQLLPLPPALWPRLPGRDLLVWAEQAAGLPRGWHPLSVAPDLTANSLLATLPAWATGLLISALPRRDLPRLLPILAAGIAAGALLGLVQAATDAGMLFPYAATNRGVATGWFANRNHHGAFVALAFPLGAAWASLRPPNRRYGPVASSSVLAVVLPLTTLAIAATGSRTALLLLIVAVVGAMLIVWRRHGMRRLVAPLRGWCVLLLPAVAALGFAPLALGTESIRRLAGLNLADDGRIALLAPLLAMARAFWPWGSGFGTFAVAFRIGEPAANLDLAWLNHAHDDLFELGIEGGIAGWAILLAGLAWGAISAGRLWRGGRHAPHEALGWLGLSWLILLGVASLTDYPLRTPTLMSLFMLAACLLDRSVHDEAEKSPSEMAEKSGLRPE